jgi:hypothetical protein
MARKIHKLKYRSKNESFLGVIGIECITISSPNIYESPGQYIEGNLP